MKSKEEVPIIPRRRIRRRWDIFPFTYISTIRKPVFVIQNIDPKILAPYGVVIFYITAYVGIQLPNPTYWPM